MMRIPAAFLLLGLVAAAPVPVSSAPIATADPQWHGFSSVDGYGFAIAPDSIRAAAKVRTFRMKLTKDDDKRFAVVDTAVDCATKTFLFGRTDLYVKGVKAGTKEPFKDGDFARSVGASQPGAEMVEFVCGS
jgi:hypothetical protein